MGGGGKERRMGFAESWRVEQEGEEVKRKNGMGGSKRGEFEIYKWRRRIGGGGEGGSGERQGHTHCLHHIPQASPSVHIMLWVRSPQTHLG